MSGRVPAAWAVFILALQCSPRPVEVIGQRDSGREGELDGTPEEAADPPRDRVEALPEAPAEAEEVLADVSDLSEDPPNLACTNCRQVTFESDPEWELIWFTVRGNYLVYDLRKYYSREARMVLVDLSSLETRTIIDPLEAGYKACKEPAIFGNQVFFLCLYYPQYPDLDPTTYDFILYDIPSDNISIVYSITFDEEEAHHSAGISDLRIWGDYVAWVDCTRIVGSASCSQEVALLNLGTGELVYINDGHKFIVSRMKMWGDHIIYGAVDVRWDSSYYNQEDLFVYDIPSSMTIQLTQDTIDQCKPDIWENRIVWADCRSDPDAWGCFDWRNPDIYTMELGGEEMPVETEGSLQDNPSICGDIIAWDDERNDITPNDTATGNRWEVFALNLGTGEKRMITESVGGRGAGQPQVNDGKIYLLLYDAPPMPNVYEFTF